MTCQREQALLILANFIFFIGVMIVSLVSGAINPLILTVCLLVILGWILLHYTIRKIYKSADYVLLPAAALLTGIGLMIILRLKPMLFYYQALWVGIGLAAFLGCAQIARRIDVLAEYKYVTGAIGLLLLLSAILFGVDIGGNKNWIILGPLRFQPSEFAKLFIVTFLAAYLSERQEVLSLATKNWGHVSLPHPRFIAPLLLIWGLAMGMLVLQRDLGAALLYFSVSVAMTYMASGRLNYVILGVLLFIIGAGLAYMFYPHVQTRIDIWLNPWSDPNGKAYQITQSFFSIGSGGVLGSGLGSGHPDFIPEVHTDFVFAAIAEELGLAGAAAVLVSYIIIIYRGFRTALLAQSPFQALLASGLATFIGLQVFVIVGGVTGFLPLTGITLPMISYGGSSLVANFMVLGLLFAVSETGNAQ